MTFADAVRSVLTNYANFSGRARRSEYWYFVLAYFIAVVVVRIIDQVATGGFLSLLLALAVIVPALAVGVRRLHDTDRSGWWLLLGLIPLVGTIILIVWAATDSTPDNQYGPNPKGSVGGYGGYGVGAPPPPPYAG